MSRPFVSLSRHSLQSLQLLPSLSFRTLLFTTLTASVAHAQAPQQTDQIIITANRLAETVDAPLQSATVITRQTIAASGATDLPSLLARAGVQVQVAGGPGQPAAVLLRGASGAQTLILLDGVRMASVSTGAAALEHLPLAAIERIEIVRGPLSGLYGSDALGGVIQIVTRAQAQRAPATATTSAEAVINAGNLGQRELSASLLHASTDWQVSLSAGDRRINASSATNERAGQYTYNPDRDPYQQQHVNLGLRRTFALATEMGVQALASQAVADYDGGPSSRERNFSRINSLRLYGFAPLPPTFAPDWQARVELKQGEDKSRIEGSYPGQFNTRRTQWLVQLQGKQTLAAVALATTIGLERDQQRLASDTPYDRTQRTSTGGFVSGVATLGQHRGEWALRRERDDQFGGQTTGSVGYGVMLGSDWRVAGSAGQAFRAPSFNDLYYPGYSNPDLRPEKSRSQELSLRWLRGTQQAQLTVFSNKVRDLISFNSTTFLPENIARARTRGAELALSTRIDSAWGSTQLSAHLTQQQARDGNSGKRLRGRAEQIAAFSVDHQAGPFAVSVGLNGAGNRFDAAGELASARLGGYGVLAGKLRYQVSQTVSLWVAGQNLTDRQYTLTRGYNPQGRSIQLGASVALN